MRITKDALAANDGELSLIAAQEGGVPAPLALDLASKELVVCRRTGMFPADTTVAERPRVVYDGAGAPLLYEIVVLNEQGESVGAIAVVCNESQGPPISHIVPRADRSYSRVAAELMQSGNVGQMRSLRLVAECYPAVWLAPMVLSGDGGDFTSLYDPTNATPISRDVAGCAVGVEALLSEHPEVVQQLSLDARAARDTTMEHRRRVEDIWREVHATSGERGGWETVAEGMLKSFRELQSSGVMNAWRTGWCGPSALNWALGYLDFASQMVYDPRSLSQFRKLNDALGVDETSNDPWKGITLPWRVDNGVEAVTNGAWTSDWCTPRDVKTSIDADRPGLSLRSSRFNAGTAALQWHYRDVAAYRELSWGPFRWVQYGVWDPNGIDFGFPLCWETWNPFFHVFSSRIMKSS